MGVVAGLAVAVVFVLRKFVPRLPHGLVMQTGLPGHFLKMAWRDVGCEVGGCLGCGCPVVPLQRLRKTVHAAQLHGDVAGAKVAFFEHHHVNALAFAQLDGGMVVFARLTKQNHTVNGVLLK